MSALTHAIQTFNETFEYDLRLPIVAENVEAAAELAALRGRQDVANLLREALNEEVTA